MSDHAIVGDRSAIEVARERNRSLHGDNAEEYAADIGAGYCPDCLAVYFSHPEGDGDEHSCPARR